MRIELNILIQALSNVGNRETERGGGLSAVWMKESRLCSEAWK